LDSAKRPQGQPFEVQPFHYPQVRSVGLRQPGAAGWPGTWARSQRVPDIAAYGLKRQGNDNGAKNSRLHDSPQNRWILGKLICGASTADLQSWRRFLLSACVDQAPC
jgi:hypothetical protein